MPKVFLSYRRSDNRHVTDRIYDRLVAQWGADSVFKDIDAIPLGTDFRRVLAAAIENSDVLLVVVGDRWAGATNADGRLRLEDPNDFVRMEIETALEREIPIIPLLVDGAAMPPESRVPASLRAFAYRQGSIVRPDPDFHSDMDRIVRAVVRQAPKPPPADEFPTEGVNEGESRRSNAAGHAVAQEGRALTRDGNFGKRRIADRRVSAAAAREPQALALRPAPVEGRNPWLGLAVPALVVALAFAAGADPPCFDRTVNAVLTAAVVLAVWVFAATRRRSAASRRAIGAWTMVLVVALLTYAWLFFAFTVPRDTHYYRVVVGYELSEVGRRYTANHPEKSVKEILEDGAEDVFTKESYATVCVGFWASWAAVHVALVVVLHRKLGFKR